MRLSPGSQLGAYEILSLIGAGGMGEVYRARDTRLKRDVAVKIVPETFARDLDRGARFRREAELLAALNHPHIAAVYGLEETPQLSALVLELVEGPTLADRLTQGAVPIDEALPIARQIAEALEAAHEKGIIHRDLKPSNVKLRPDGTVKVLDFGLAKSVGGTSSGDLAESPTALSPGATVAGVIVGTAAYMSPEQARGKPVDERTDIWAFGCVLYEMFAGRHPFAGDTLSDTVAAILRSEPDWRWLPRQTPARIRSLIARCLRKDPAHRLRDIADGRYQIEEVLNEPGPSAAIEPVHSHRAWVPWILAAVLLATTMFFTARPSMTSSASPISFAVFPPEGAAFSPRINATLNVPSFAMAPDGRSLVFAAEMPGATPMLWLRPLDRVAAERLPGTEDAQDPFWSPDSRWIGFFADGQLKRTAPAGGPVQVITDATTDFRGGTWGPDGTVLFGSARGPIFSVNVAGGNRAPVTTVDASQRTYRHPQFLPDGRHFLYSLFASERDKNGIYVGSLDGAAKKLLIARNTTAVYAPPGFLLFVDGDRLLGQAFDLEHLEIRGQPSLVAEHVGRTTAFMSAVSASRTGIIAYSGTLSRNGRLVWYDREGHPTATLDTPEGDYTDFRLSPDGQRLAASLVDRKTGAIDIWLTDLERHSSFRVASGELVAASALWSPDGETLGFRSNRTGTIELYQRSTGGGGGDRRLLVQEDFAAARIPSNNITPTDWSPDGRNIMFSVPAPGNGYDLWLLPTPPVSKPHELIVSPGDQFHGNFSPSGGLVAYTSNESGRFEVYVETLPRSDRKWAVSTNGGYEPRWRADGREMYFLSEDREVMAVSVGAGPSFGIPRRLFQTHVAAGVTPMRMHYVPSRNGQRFLVNVATDTPPSPITVVINWTGLLKGE